jgi:hypothetical protein
VLSAATAGDLCSRVMTMRYRVMLYKFGVVHHNGLSFRHEWSGDLGGRCDMRNGSKDLGCEQASSAVAEVVEELVTLL